MLAPRLRTGEGFLAIDVRMLGPDDADLLETVAPEMFDNVVDRKLARELLMDPRHHLAAAVDGSIIVGMASAVDYIHPDKPVELWINEVGVAPEYRGRGIGTRLLQALLNIGRELGCRAAWVGTEQDNEPACRLYAAAGGKPEPFVMYSFELGDSVATGPQEGAQ
jgi:aminoglycoside 6'-N-acetyltransferase I